MAAIKPAYSSATPTAIAITMKNQSNDTAVGSTTVDNTTTLYDDALVQMKTKTGSGCGVNDTIELYVWGSLDGTLIPDNASGTDGAVTMNDPPNSSHLGRIETPTASNAYVSNTFSVCEALKVPALPPYWGVIEVNRSDSTLTNVDADHGMWFVGVYSTVA